MQTSRVGQLQSTAWAGWPGPQHCNPLWLKADHVTGQCLQYAEAQRFGSTRSMWVSHGSATSVFLLSSQHCPAQGGCEDDTRSSTALANSKLNRVHSVSTAVSDSCNVCPVKNQTWERCWCDPTAPISNVVPMPDTGLIPYNKNSGNKHKHKGEKAADTHTSLW